MYHVFLLLLYPFDIKQMIILMRIKERERKKRKTAKTMRRVELLWLTLVDVNAEMCCMSFWRFLWVYEPFVLQFVKLNLDSLLCTAASNADAVTNVQRAEWTKLNPRQWWQRKAVLLQLGRCCSGVCRPDCRWNQLMNNQRLSLSRWEKRKGLILVSL